ncbi:hypothetical protein CEXT_26981 [Caerostris extrusa]|uniref:Uncharacterized protein n=1 Tax=Caerostris extrusa TaxID=172846 RepID=A0AAV4XGU1_CAEEX|nr:hypothetical protein CEXT_26981 [Caerostris extrusa]
MFSYHILHQTQKYIDPKLTENFPDKPFKSENYVLQTLLIMPMLEETPPKDYKKHDLNRPNLQGSNCFHLALNPRLPSVFLLAESGQRSAITTAHPALNSKLLG